MFSFAMTFTSCSDEAFDVDSVNKQTILVYYPWTGSTTSSGLKQYLANNIDSHMVFNPEKVSKWAAIIPCYTAGISNDERSNQTFLNWFNEYTMVKHDKSVIHSNTTKIDEVKCLDRKLIRCYLIKNNTFQNPILMVKCYDKLIKQYADRTHWRPLALSAAEKQTEKILEKLGVKTDVTTAGPDYTYALRAIAKQIEERDLKRKQKEEQKNS